MERQKTPALPQRKVFELEKGKDEVHIDLQHPFLGLRSFNEKHKDFFFGRNQEIEELVQLVFKHKATFVYGRSGVGKTSLLRAGVVPVLRRKYYLPIFLRIDFASRTLRPIEQMQEAFFNEVRKVDSNFNQRRGRETFWEYLHYCKILNGFVKPVFIFDQFEEVFTLADAAADVEELVTELTDLATGQVPLKVQERYFLAKDSEYPDYFHVHDYRLVFSFKEDFLPHVESLELHTSQMRNSHFRVMTMRGWNALEAIHQPAKMVMSQDTAEHIARKLPASKESDYPVLKINNLSWEDKHIEPFILSLFCHRLNEKRLARQMELITKELVDEEEVDDTVKTYYLATLQQMPERVQVAIEESLVTAKGFRKMEALEVFLNEHKLSREQVDRLVEKKIVSLSQRKETSYVELVHDVLTPVIAEMRSQRQLARLREQERRVERERHEKEMERERVEKQEQKRKNKRASFTLILAISIIVVLGNMLYQQRVQDNQLELQNHEIKSKNQMLLAANHSSTDPTMAFRHAQQGYLEAPELMGSWSELIKHYYLPDAFYQTIAQEQGTITCFDLQGDLVAYGTKHSIVLLRLTDRSTFVLPTQSEEYVWDLKLYQNNLGQQRMLVQVGRETFDYQLESWGGDVRRDRIPIESRILQLDIAPSASSLILACSDQKAIMLNMAGLEIASFDTKEFATQAVFLQEAQQLATITRKGILATWSVDGRELAELDLGQQLNALAESPVRKQLAVAGALGDVLLVDSSSQQWETLKGGDAPMTAVCFSPNGDCVAAGDEAGQIFVWRMDDLSPLPIARKFLCEQGKIEGLEFTPDGQHLISASKDGKLLSWQVNNPRETQIGKGIAYKLIECASNGNLVCYAKNGNVELRSPEGNLLAQHHFDRVITALACHPTSGEFVTGDELGGFQFWDAQGKLTRSDSARHSQAVADLAFNADGSILLSGGNDGFLALWNPRGELLRRQSQPIESISKLAFSHDQSKIIAGTVGGALYAFDLELAILTRLRDGDHSQPISGICPTPDESLALFINSSTSQGILRLRPDGSSLALTGPLDNAIASIDYTPNRGLLLTVDKDSKIVLWDTRGHELWRRSTEHRLDKGVFSHDGRRIYILNEKQEIWVYDIDPETIFHKVDQLKLFGELPHLPEP